jgi:hypothetical protein
MTTVNQFVAVIMAGGLGKRMNSTLPKVLHMISNEPMIVRIIKEVSTIQPKKIFIVVGKYKSIIETTIARYIDLHLYNIEFILQPEALGTGHAIQCCVPELSKYDFTNVLVLSGDVPLLKSSTMLSLLYNVHKAKIMVTELENPTGYGRILENMDTHQIQIVEEKDCSPQQKQIRKVNGGIYAFESHVLCRYIGMLTNDNSQQEYYLTDVIAIIQREENTAISLLEIPKENQLEILGVNTPEQLLDLEEKQHQGMKTLIL